MMSILKRVAALASAMALVACGGGGTGVGSGGSGGGGSGGGTPGKPSIVVSLSNATVTGANPATVSAVVRDGTGAGVAGQVVSFSTAAGLGKFSAPTALTDSTGTAAVTVQPATTSTVGADEVVASASVNSTAVSARVGFQLAATSVTIASFTTDVATLAAYAQANLTVNLAGTTAGVPVNLAVSSACVTKGKATLTPTSATTSTATASFTYRDGGCGATDVTDNTQISVVGTSATSSVSLRLTSPTVSSIAFVSAVPSTIYLKSSGLNETSQVTFQVRDTAGNGLAGQNVALELVSAAGGVTLDGGSVLVSKVTDNAGNVIARINSGTVPTAVRVKATLVSANISTVSSNLAVAVGLPSQLNFSLSQKTKNIEGCDIDGTPNSYQIIASDRLGNPVPDGTSINFVTEGGQIEAIKFTLTSGGLSTISANFLSASPRPADCRITVLAYALGEESFLDTNGDNLYTTGEDVQDLGDVFLSRSYKSVYDASVDQLISPSNTGNAACRTPTSPLLSIVRDRSIPSRAATCDGAWGRAYVRRATETVFSATAARPVWASKPSNLYANTGSSCPVAMLGDVDLNNPDALIVRDYYLVGGGAALYNLGAIGIISFYASDTNSVRLNPMALGTVVSLSVTDGIEASVAGGSPVPNTNLATFVSINYKFTTASSGTLTVKFTSPSGLQTSVPLFIASGAAGAGLSVCP